LRLLQISKNRVGNPNFDMVNLLSENKECDRRTDRQHITNAALNYVARQNNTEADKYNAAHTLNLCGMQYVK